MKIKISKFLFILTFVLAGTWPPNGGPKETGKQIPIPGRPPIIVVFPGGGK
jgi:hypothetical protein